MEFGSSFTPSYSYAMGSNSLLTDEISSSPSAGPYFLDGKEPQQQKKPTLKRRMSYPIQNCDMKWSQYIVEILSWQQKPQKSTTLQYLIRAGIPNHLRPQVWVILSGSKFLMEKNPGYYRKLLDDNKGVKTLFTRQIETDLCRTFPELIDFSTQYSAKPPSIAKLRSVLTAYGFRNPRVGYCQGMNFLAGFLLRFFNEEEAFFMLVSIIDVLLPAHYYESDLRGIKAETDLFAMIIQRELPELYNHLEANGIDIGMFTLDWFVSLFIFSYRMSTVSRIWDLFLYEGRVSLFCVAVGILREVEKMILKINRMDHLFDLLKNLNKVDLNWEKIIKNCNIPAMSNIVKRLSFCVVQTPTYIDAIQNSQATQYRKSPNEGYLINSRRNSHQSNASPRDRYLERRSREKQREEEEEKEVEEESGFFSIFSRWTSKNKKVSATMPRTRSTDRNKYFG